MNVWLQLKQVNHSASHNLICLPFAGGFVEYYLAWLHSLPRQFQLCPIQLPGHSYRWQEQAYVAVDVFIENLAPALAELLNENPYVLFGHSMGGYLAYKLCERLKQYGFAEPELLVVSSVPAPLHWERRRLLSEYSVDEFKTFFLELGGFHPELMKHPQFIESQMQLLRSDILLCESCTYTKPAQFNFPVLAFGGKQDDYVSIEAMQSWQQETASLFQLHAFDGGHFYLNTQVTPMFEKINVVLSSKLFQ